MINLRRLHVKHIKKQSIEELRSTWEQSQFFTTQFFKPLTAGVADTQTNRQMDEWTDRHYKDALGLLVQNEKLKLSKGYYHNCAKIKESCNEISFVMSVPTVFNIVRTVQQKNENKKRSSILYYYILFYILLLKRVETKRFEISKDRRETPQSSITFYNYK